MGLQGRLGEQRRDPFLPASALDEVRVEMQSFSVHLLPALCPNLPVASGDHAGGNHTGRAGGMHGLEECNFLPCKAGCLLRARSPPRGLQGRGGGTLPTECVAVAESVTRGDFRSSLSPLARECWLCPEGRLRGQTNRRDPAARPCGCMPACCRLQPRRERTLRVQQTTESAWEDSSAAGTAETDGNRFCFIPGSQGKCSTKTGAR